MFASTTSPLDTSSSGGCQNAKQILARRICRYSDSDQLEATTSAARQDGLTVAVALKSEILSNRTSKEFEHLTNVQDTIWKDRIDYQPRGLQCLCVMMAMDNTFSRQADKNSQKVAQNNTQDMLN